MLDVKMKETCRICARELCGNQRRWIFHPASKLNLQVLLSHALGRELTRDGRGEFACSKCAFMLDRMYRFDTVIARVEALSLERLHKLLSEKDRLRQCICGLYRKNNAVESPGPGPGPGTGPGNSEVGLEDSPVVDLSALQDARYNDLIQEDLAYSVYESWADQEDPALEHQTPPPQHHHQCPGSEALPGQRPRRCRGCAALRVADSDYEAVCKVPRCLGRRSTSCGPSTRYSGSMSGPEEGSEVTQVPSVSPPAGPESDRTLCDRTCSSPSSSAESLDTAVDVCPPFPCPRESSASGLEETLSLVRSWEYKPVKTQQGSRLPVLVKAKLDQGVSLGLALPLRSLFRGAVDCELYPHPGMEVGTAGRQQDLADMEEQWLDDFVQCGPFRFQQKLIEEQQSQLGQYEGAAGRCVGELQKAQQQVQSLQAKIRESDCRNQKLQMRLGEMEGELRSAREEAQKQERHIQNLNDSVSTKETEAAELYRVIEEQNNMLCSLKEFVNRNKLTQLQVSGAESVRGQGEALELQASLFRAQLELQASQRAQSQASRKEEDLSRALQRLEHDLQGALEHRENTHRHNQELQMALEKARSELLDIQEQQREKEGERLREEEVRERTIRELRNSLQTKDQLLQDYSELLEQHQQGQKRDSLLSKLRERISERDRALERAVDEKFRRVEEKEEEVRRLQLLLREKERDLETQRCVLSNNQETITSLEVLLRGKGVELEQVGEAWRGVQRYQQESEERHARILRERDTLISQLQSTLHSRTQEAEDLTSALLGRVQAGPGEVLEGLKARLQLKERLFQELLSDRSLQAREHQAQVQALLSTIAARDQYIKDSAGRLGEVMSEQTLRLQELRKQLTWASTGRGPEPGAGVDLQTLQEELQLGLRREREALEDIHNQAAQLEVLSRTVAAKEEIIKDLQLQLVEPSGLPLVERLTQELQELRQRQGRLAAASPRQGHYGELSTEEEDDVTSEYADSIEEGEALTLANMQISDRCGGPGKGELSQDAAGEGQGLLEVRQLVEQKRVVERELGELKAQLEKAGFSSLSQMRKAFFSLREENDHLKKEQQVTVGCLVRDQREEQRALEEEELDLDLEEEEEEEEEVESLEPWEAYEEVSQGGLGPPASLKDSQGQRRSPRPLSLDLGGLLVHSSQEDDLETEIAGSRQQRGLESEACVEAVLLQQHSRELQERLMVSEATVQAQAEQLKDYRELLTESSVQQDSKQVQVDLQDLGYETCGRSENEAEREDASSPEFDDLEMCTSLDCGSQWWPAPVHHGKAGGVNQDVPSLQRMVEDLRSQLARSQTAVRELQNQLLSTSSSQVGASTPRRVNWGTQASPPQSGPEEDEGWQSSDGGVGPSPRHPGPDRDLQKLETRVGALEDQLRKGKGPPGASQENKPGKFDTLIQAQARELSVLRQRVREGLGVCHILTRHLGDTTKAFEELLRANDIDYYMGQSFREQLAQSSALAQRVGTKISGRDHPEMSNEKTGPELVAIRLSEELQQKDKVIESLQTKLQSQPRSDTPCSSHALSETTDQSDRISFASDEQGSTNEDLELCSEIDAASEYGQEEGRSSRTSADSLSLRGSVSHHPSIPLSSASSHGPRSICSPSMHCPPHNPADMQGQTGYSMPQTKAFQGFPPTPHNTQADHTSFLPLSYPPYHPTHSGLNACLNTNPATKPGPSLLESSALWEMTYGPRERLGADVSSGSSGYQSGSSHTGSELMKEHLREIRHLRQRLEDSIQTNERLRQQLEDRLASAARETGAPTNIYIQGLDSVSQLSNEIRALKDDNVSLQGQLKQACREGSKEAEHLREAVLMGRARLKEAELEAERWAEQGRRLQSLTHAQSQEITQLKQERLSNQETINRLQEQVTLLQQQLCEARGLAQSLQHQLDANLRGRGLPRATPPGPSGKTSRSAESLTFDPRDLQVQLEQQLSGKTGQGGHARRMLFLETLASPPVRDIGLFSPTSPLSPPLRPEKATDKEAGVSGHAPDGSFSSQSGCHMVGHVDDFTALQQQLLEGCLLIRQLETTLRSSSSSHALLELSLDKPADAGSLRNLQTSTKTLRQILEEASSLLRMFWRAALPSRDGIGPSAKKEQALREEISSLRVTVSEQEAALKTAMDRLKTSNHTKDNMEHFIVSQLTRTRDVLKKAKSNLQERTLDPSVSLPALLVGIS